MGLIFIILFVFIVLGVVYSSLGANNGVDHAWVAFIPFGNYYVAAKVADLPELIWILPIAGAINSILFPQLRIFIGLLLVLYSIWADRELLDNIGRNKNMAFLHLIPGVGSLIVFTIIAIESFN